MQLPGVSDVARAKEIIRSTAQLQLKIVEAGPMSSQEALLQQYNGKIPDDMEVIPGAAGSDETGTAFYLVRKIAAVTGQDLRNAQPTLDENGRPAVGFSLTREGSSKFGKVTGDNIGRALAIILDNRVQSAPRIEGRINDNGRIYGSFTQEQVTDLSLVLELRRAAGVDELSRRAGHRPDAGPGLDPVGGPGLAGRPRAGRPVHAGLLQAVGDQRGRRDGRQPVILLGLMAYFGATMTLPGIAGFILTMGMGVDSNVLIFERIKEELAAGQPARNAVNKSFDRVFLTLLDTHVTSLIAAAFLFQFGTGPIRGFATTLTIGLLTNLFTSIFVSKTLFEAALLRAAGEGITEYLGHHEILFQSQLRLRQVAVARDRASR